VSVYLLLLDRSSSPWGVACVLNIVAISAAFFLTAGIILVLPGLIDSRPRCFELLKSKFVVD
jgi:hypothetical protein